MTPIARLRTCALIAGWLTLIPAPALATEDDSGLWGIFTSTDHFETANGTSRWRYWFDGQARYFDLGSGRNQYVLRPGIGYDVSDNMSVMAGYGYFHSRSASGATSHEDRFWQQLAWNVAKWNQGAVSMRTRLEQRSVSRGSDLGWVLRHQVKYVRPVGETGDLEFIASIEPFVDLRDTDWGGDSGLGQNRTSIGLGWKLSPKLAIETGYMHQYIWVENAENVANHLGIVNFKMKF